MIKGDQTLVLVLIYYVANGGTQARPSTKIFTFGKFAVSTMSVLPKHSVKAGKGLLQANSMKQKKKTFTSITNE